MSQDNLVKLQCTECKRVTHFTRKNRRLKVRLEIKKGCKFCGKKTGKSTKHTLHKETK